MKSKVAIILLFVSAIAIGFAMENLKVNINYILERGGAIQGFFDQDFETKKAWLDGNRELTPFDYYYNHERMEWLFHCSQSQLVKLKWFNSVFFTVVFMFINAWLIRLLTGEKKFFSWTMFFYALFFAISFGIYLLGKLSGTLDNAYGVSRKIAGALQSLVPLMILLPASWLVKYMKETKDEKLT